MNTTHFEANLLMQAHVHDHSISFQEKDLETMKNDWINR